MNREDMIEKLSDIEHDRWCNWQKYLHSCCIKNQDGSLTIPKKYVEHWKYEINTKYKDLPENIKESDRKEVYKIIPIIDEYLRYQLEEKEKVIDNIRLFLKENKSYEYESEKTSYLDHESLLNLLKILERGKND